MSGRLFVAVLAILQSGCFPFLSNEQQTALWMSKEKRIATFKRDLDFQIGMEFHAPMQKEDWCKTHQCAEISESVTEYIEELVSKDVPSKKCVIAWHVDAKQSKGNYHYSSGQVPYGLGRRLSWRYVSEPGDCLSTWTNFATTSPGLWFVKYERHT
jgi:hypothetical protein